MVETYNLSITSQLAQNIVGTQEKLANLFDSPICLLSKWYEIQVGLVAA